MRDKKIIDSWSKIRPRDATHDRILNNILASAPSKKGKVNKMAITPYWKILAPITACVLLALIIAIPVLMRDDAASLLPHHATGDTLGADSNNQQDPEGGVSGNNQATDSAASGNQQDSEAVDPSNQQAPPVYATQDPTYELVFNEILEPMSATPGRVPGGQTFAHDVTDEELEHILPDLGFPVFARATYLYDGTLFGVIAGETCIDGETVIFGDIYMRTLIHISPSDISPRPIFYGFEPVISYVYDIPVEAGVLENIGIMEDDVALFTASFVLEGIYYSVSTHDYISSESAVARLTEMVNTIIRNGPADLSIISDPEIPEMRNEALTQDEARADTDFGAFLPTSIPAGLGFGDARRVVDQHNNWLTADWHEPWNASISWHVAAANEHHIETLVSIHDREKFDVSLYTIPWMDSVPRELIAYVSNPVFLADEITLEAIQARALISGRAGDWASPSINFGVLFGDIAVQINSNGLTPEEVWEMLSDLL